MERWIREKRKRKFKFIIMVSLIFFIIAAACSAFMDTLAHRHPKSIFQKFKKGFWSDAFEESWKEKYVDWDSGDRSLRKLFPNFKSRFKIINWIGKINYPVQISDGWHFFKTIMIFAICISVVPFKPIVFYEFNSQFLIYLITFIFYGVVWNWVFNAFYNWILVKDKIKDTFYKIFKIKQ